MLKLNSVDINTYGLVNAISIKSASYIAELIPAINEAKFPPRIKYLKSIVLHTDPHIDEYFASLIFRTLYKESRNIPFREQSLYSFNNDIYANTTWPNAAVFGIGALYKKRGGIDPLLSYDEHVVNGQKRFFPSCTAMVLDLCFPKRSLFDFFDKPLQLIYGEINHLDSDANAHPQNIAIIIKDLHNVNLLLQRGEKPSQNIYEVMSPAWKRMIVDVLFTSIAYCLKENIFPHNSIDMGHSITEMYEYYLNSTLLQKEPDFDLVSKQLKGKIYNVQKTISEATLKAKDSKGNIVQRLDSRGHPIPQRMILPRISLSIERCWGKPLATFIMANLFETMILSQLSYQKVYRAIENCISASSGKNYSCMTEVGWFEFRCCKSKSPSNYNGSLWLLSLSVKNDVIRPNRAMQNILKNKNDGHGIILIQNNSIATKAIFCGSGYQNDKWSIMAEELTKFEGDADNENIPGCWHKTINEFGVLSDFLLNGNTAHRYIPRSKLNIDSLKMIIENI